MGTGRTFVRLIVASAWAISSASVCAQDNVYFGNLHAHTVYSDGSGAPDEAFDAAREAGLDFMAITEHSHKEAEGSGDSQRLHIARDSQLYNGNQPSSLVSAAARHTVQGDFVAIYGQEYSTISKGNHVNVFDIPEVIDVPNQKFADLISWTGAHLDSLGLPAIIQFNHPALADDDHLEYGRDQFGSEVNWIATMDAQAQLIELFNGPAKAQTTGLRSAAVQERDYYEYLNLGFHLAPSVGHDNHYHTWGAVTDARVAVIAPELTKQAVLGALRARHAYASSDRNLRLVFRAGSALQGDVVPNLPPLEEDLGLTLSIADDDEGEATYRIDVFSDVPGGDPIDRRRPANSFTVTGDTTTPLTLDGVPFLAVGQYVLVRVKQLPADPEDEQETDVAWTAPIWFEAPAVPPLPGPGMSPSAPLQVVRLTRVLPDPAGPDLRNETVWLKNDSNAAVDLAGWVLLDLSGNEWSFGGTLGAGQERAFVSDGQRLSLNNDGDQLELRDPDGNLVQSASYPAADRDEEVTIP